MRASRRTTASDGSAPRPGSATTTRVTSIGRTKRAETIRKTRRLLFIEGSMQPAEWVVRVILDADLEVEPIGGESHRVTQRYHIVLGFPQLREAGVEGQNAPGMVHHRGQAVALERRGEEHLA